MIGAPPPGRASNFYVNVRLWYPPLMSGIRIGEAASRLGVTTRTRRYYEEMGLLASPGRQSGGYRVYDEEEMRRLERIRELKDLLGLNLVVMKEILTAEDELASLRLEYFADPEDDARRSAILSRALEINSRLRSLVGSKMAGLERMRSSLEERARVYKRAMRQMKAGARS